MSNRRPRPFDSMDAGSVLKTGAILYISISLIAILIFALLPLLSNLFSDQISLSMLTQMQSLIPSILWGFCLFGLGIILLLLRKCRKCKAGPAQTILNAMNKMKQGDLGWKITLPGESELSHVADSASIASLSLAEKIGKLQTQTEELVEIERYLIDCIECSSSVDPHTLTALRSMRICTNRLKSGISDFNLSSLPSAADEEKVMARS